MFRLLYHWQRVKVLQRCPGRCGTRLHSVTMPLDRPPVRMTVIYSSHVVQHLAEPFTALWKLQQP